MPVSATIGQISSRSFNPSVTRDPQHTKITLGPPREFGMTARLIRRNPAQTHSHYSALRLALVVLALLVFWLIVISAAAGAEPPRFPFPGGPGGKMPADFDPQKFFEAFFGKAAGNVENDALLKNVEISWNEESRMGQQLLDDLKDRLAAQKKTIVD